jgi:GntR family transcriptional regulator
MIAYNVISIRGPRKMVCPSLATQTSEEPPAAMARSPLALGPVPMHHQVYLDLRSSLDDATWKPGERVPTERQLARHYGVSLITVRRALAELAQQGRIERTRGRGTFVLRPRLDRDIASRASFADEMQERGLDPETRLISARPQSALPTVASALRLESGSPTLYLERLRLAGGEPYLLEQVHLPAERFPGLLASDLEHVSLYELLATRYDTPVVRAREALEPVLLRAREAALLGQRRRAAALLIEGIAYTTDDSPVEFGRTFVRGDRSRYYVEREVARPIRPHPAEELAPGGGAFR